MPNRTKSRSSRDGFDRGSPKPRPFALVACFATFSTLLVLCSAAAEELPCSDCHDKDPDPAAFAESVHGFLECVDCHTAAEDFPHSEGVGEVECSMCHNDIAALYEKSVHGEGRAAGQPEAPSCATCHGDIHRLVPVADPTSPVHPTRLPETCGSCHSNPTMVEKYGIPVAKPIAAYNDSVHAQRVAAGEPAASCSSCHGSHAIFAAADPRSTVFHTRVPETCGECHEQITEDYDKSVHGKAVAHGAREAPVCTDCHGEHRILSPEVKSSPVYASNIPKMTCGRCHGDLRLAEKYDIPERAVTAYEDSYHGLASRAGNSTVANCASCHGVHDILPSSDPASHVYKDNLAATCGKCHPGAGTKFAIGTVHVLPSEQKHAAVYWVRWVYLWLIYLTIGGMVLHNLLDLYRKARSPSPPARVAGPTRERMMFGFRVAHAAMIVSFVVLVYSGFALKFPESWWAAPLLRWEGNFAFRGWVHRGAALLMLAALLHHIVHLIVDRRARRCLLRGMIPTWHDVTELRERLRWFVGWRKEPVKSPTLGYPEKMEYIALMWGIVVMTVTGFMLWFDDIMLRLFPKWVGDVATVIHLYEAILASLAILVWHFYFVIFDPVVYPMDTAWITGRESPGRAAEREESPETEDHQRVVPKKKQKGPTASRRVDGGKQPAAG